MVLDMVDKKNQKIIMQLKKIALINAFFIYAFVVTGCQSNPPVQQRVTHEVYKLGSSDKVRVGVYEHENLSGTYSVDDTGSLSLPLVGRFTAKGLTVMELEKLVTKELKENYIADPKVSIEVVEIHPFCVIGEVLNQGCFPYAYGLTADKAIAFAGGYTYRAVKNKFVISREDGTVVHGTHSTPVYSGDVIEVTERYF